MNYVKTNTMKKLLLVLLFFPLVSFGQTKEELQLCLAAQSSSFTSDSEANNALDRILNVIGASKNFVLTPCSEINNAMATSYKGIRYILYDKAFMQLINSRTNDWASLAILAHEVAHHINGHTLDLTMYAGGVVEAASLSVKRKQELEADEFAGFILARLGATLEEALAFTKVFEEKDDTYDTHPTKSKRVVSVTRGFNSGVVKKEVEIVYVKDKPNLSADEYFIKGLELKNQEKYSEALVYFEASIKINPNLQEGYFNCGLMSWMLNNNHQAVVYFTKALKFTSDYAPVYPMLYLNRGRAKFDQELYNSAIDDFNKSIELDSNNPEVFIYRGKSKKKLEDIEGACLDWEKASRLSEDEQTNQLIKYYCSKL